MKRMLLAALLMTMAVGSSTGCCLFDRLFGCPRGYPVTPGPCGPSGCGPACGHAGPGNGPLGGSSPGCQNCVSGVQPPAGGPYAPYGGGPGAFANCPGGCQAGSGNYAGRIGVSGPPSAAVSYPYYTTRGPRDFFVNNPSTIGP